MRRAEGPLGTTGSIGRWSAVVVRPARPGLATGSRGTRRPAPGVPPR